MTERSATYYDVLQVSRRAKPERVRTAYRRLAQQFHPDRRQGCARSEQVMAAINEAYAVLSDPQRRAEYDRRIEMQQAGERLARQRRLAVLDDPGAAWPWWLLFATIAFSAFAIGVSVYKGYVPGARVAAVTR